MREILCVVCCDVFRAVFGDFAADVTRCNYCEIKSEVLGEVRELSR